MPSKKSSGTQIEVLNESTISAVSRRRFLGYLGAGSALLATAAVAASCKKDDPTPTPTPTPTPVIVDLGSGDVGVLNYAYALEQLEAAFYTKVASSFYSGITSDEQAYLTDIRDHEQAHRNFFKAAITAAGATPIQDLEVDFSTIDFSNRASVLGAAKAFEDLGVTAYNGAGKLIADANYLLIAGKIVSVEARHAALIADLISYGTFAATTDSNGLDGARTPAEVLAIADTYIVTQINASNLPTS